MNNVLVTGISGGIGSAVAQQLLSDGSTVIGVDHELSDAIQELADAHPEHLVLSKRDIADVDSLPGMVRELVKSQGRIGGFVHCAGFDKMRPLHLAKAHDYESLWRIHALAAMVLVGAISKRTNHDDTTSIVLISSQSAHEGAQGHAAYAAAKGAIEGFLAPAAAELMDKGIRINEVCLAPIRTPMSQGWMSKLTDEGKQRLTANYPLGIGEPEDAAGLICYLLSKESRFINGQIITADAGHAVRKV